MCLGCVLWTPRRRNYPASATKAAPARCKWQISHKNITRSECFRGRGADWNDCQARRPELRAPFQGHGDDPEISGFLSFGHCASDGTGT